MELGRNSCWSSSGMDLEGVCWKTSGACALVSVIGLDGGEARAARWEERQQLAPRVSVAGHIM